MQFTLYEVILCLTTPASLNSISSFAQNVFYPSQNKFQFFITFILMSISTSLTFYHHMPIVGPSSSASNKNMMPKIWTYGVQLSDWVENIVV